MTKVVIIEDQTAVREMLELVLEDKKDFSIAGSTGDGYEGLELCKEEQPDLVILDIMLPGLHGVELLRRLQKICPDARVIVFSGHQNTALVQETVRAGAHGFVEKVASLTELKKGIKTVVEGGTYFGPEVAALMREAVINPNKAMYGLDVLTAREREVLKLITESYSTRQIGVKLGISAKTADNHRTNLMRKLGIHDVVSLTRYAMQLGIVEEPRSTLP